jgi:hypothetical protein
MLTVLEQLIFHKNEKKKRNLLLNVSAAFGILEHSKPNHIIPCQPAPSSAVSEIILVYAGPV